MFNVDLEQQTTHSYSTFIHSSRPLRTLYPLTGTLYLPSSERLGSVGCSSLLVSRDAWTLVDAYTPFR
jgi:hypothetical protein